MEADPPACLNHKVCNASMSVETRSRLTYDGGINVATDEMLPSSLDAAIAGTRLWVGTVYPHVGQYGRSDKQELNGCCLFARPGGSRRPPRTGDKQELNGCCLFGDESSQADDSLFLYPPPPPPKSNNSSQQAYSSRNDPLTCTMIDTILNPHIQLACDPQGGRAGQGSVPA